MATEYALVQFCLWGLSSATLPVVDPLL